MTYDLAVAGEVVAVSGGGGVGLGDLEKGLAVAFIPNQMGGGMAGDRRAYELVKAAYAGLS